MRSIRNYSLKKSWEEIFFVLFVATFYTLGMLKKNQNRNEAEKRPSRRVRGFFFIFTYFEKFHIILKNVKF
jgi:hypothetical protein